MSTSQQESNLIKPHLVFKATKFIRGEDWIVKDSNGTYERELQDHRVDVSFQCNAQVDSQTNLYGLSKAKLFLDQYDQAVQFEDNLSSHTTPAVTAFQKQSKCTQILYPPNLTQVLQPVDRHVGIQYKTAVYKAIRSVSMGLIKGQKAGSSMRMTPMKKRILITKVVAKTHDRLARTGIFHRAFVATGSQLPKQSAGSEVGLQGVDFKYDDEITAKAVQDYRNVIEAKEVQEAADRKEAARLLEEKSNALSRKFTSAVRRSNMIQHELLPLVSEATYKQFSAIATHLNADFICAGSFPAAKLATVWSTFTEEKDDVKLIYNDVDVYHGNFGNGILQRRECT